MINLWRDWQRMTRAGTMWSVTLTASEAVVGHRSKTIEDAINDPFSADHIELGRMVHEKSTAFGAAGASLARDWLAMHADMSAQGVALGKMMLGQLPTPRASLAMLNRSQRLGSAALASWVRAMAPVHQAATANAERLGKKR